MITKSHSTESLLLTNSEDFVKKKGEDMYNLIKELFPICRSITGNGVRSTLNIIKKHIPLQIKEVPSGTKVFDWTTPKEWNIRDAYVKNSKGEKIIDFNNSNLHVLSYSVPIHKKFSLEELKKHLFTLPEKPEWIPFATSYYKENWGFCMAYNQYKELKEDTYEVSIDSSLAEGNLTYGEFYIKGKTEEEVLLTCYVCHPSMCNDNLSGVALLTFLAKSLKNISLERSYRFLFIPETIGAITWLSLNEDKLKNIKAGLVATCVGDKGKSTYKKSKTGNALIDKAVEKVLVDFKQDYQILDFFPYGSDERQFCSAGFNLPIGSLMKSVYLDFPEYHTSADNLDFVKPEYLAKSFEEYWEVIFILEYNKTYLNLSPKCEPQLGKRGLYRDITMNKRAEFDKLSLFWILSFSDGTHSLLDVAIRSKIPFRTIKEAADLLESHQLIKEV